MQFQKTIVAMTTIIAACGSDSSPGSPDAAPTIDAGGSVDAPPAPQTAMPLLPTGDHLSMMITFEALPLATAAEADSKWQEAIGLGMDTGRIQFDWGEIETAPGTYDLSNLQEQITALKVDGLKSFVGLYAIDSEGESVPQDLSDPESSTGLVDGQSFDDPAVLARYRAFLDVVVPIIVRDGGFVISLVNEPESYMEAFPAERDNLINFYTAMTAHSKTLAADLAVTVTLTSLILDAPDPFHDQAIAAVDVATYNYYCLKLTDRFVLRGPLDETVSADIAGLVASANGKEVLFQELGCPSGFIDRTSVIGTSPAIQQQFFELAFAAINSTPAVRGAYIFQLVDWSDDLFDTVYRDTLEAEGLPQTFIDSFDEWLTTVGLISFADGTERPAWTTFTSALQ